MYVYFLLIEYYQYIVTGLLKVALEDETPDNSYPMIWIHVLVYAGNELILYMSPGKLDWFR